jgi:MFS family permease
MLIFLPAAATLGAKERARLDYVTEAFGDASGIGTVAVVMAVSLAVGGVVAGMLADRMRPQLLLFAGICTTALVNLATGLALLDGPLSIFRVVVSVAVEWVSAGVMIPSLLKVQATLVPQGARGSAEIVNVLRLGIGGIIGILLASYSPSSAATVLACAGVMACVGIGQLVLTRALPAPARSVTAGHPSMSLWSVLLTNGSLRRVVIADLVLTFAIPTQLSNSVLVEEGDGVLVLPVLLNGVIGVLVGRLTLLYTGSLGDVRRALLISFSLYTVVAVVAVPAALSGLLLERAELASIGIFLGSSLSAFALGMLSALVQQLVPDDVRGALSGFMAAARSLLVAGSAALLAVVIVPLSSEAALITVALLAVVALGIVRGFRGITADPR